MIEYSNHETESAIVVANTRLSLSHAAKEIVSTDQCVVALLYGWSDSDAEFWEEMGMDVSHKKGPHDIELKNPYRNVVAVSPDGAHLWTIPEVPDEPPESDIEPYYLSIWRANNDIWVRNKNQRAYRLDSETGQILENTPADRLRIGEREIEFEGGWIQKVLHLNDGVAVITDQSNYPDRDGRNLYVVNDDGTERWWIGDKLEGGGPDAPPFTNIWLKGDELHAYATDGYEYYFDLEDGTLLGQEWVK